MQIVKKAAALNEGWTEILTLKGGRYIALNGIAYILAGFSAYGMNPIGMAYFMGLSMSGYANDGGNGTMFCLSGSCKVYGNVVIDPGHYPAGAVQQNKTFRIYIWNLVYGQCLIIGTDRNISG